MLINRGDCSCSSKVFAAAPAVLYPARFAMELRIEKEDASYILYNLSRAGARMSEIFLS